MKTTKIILIGGPNVAIGGDDKAPIRISIPLNATERPTVGATVKYVEIAGKRNVFKGLVSESKK